jgi:hypothetical protein
MNILHLTPHFGARQFIGSCSDSQTVSKALELRDKWQQRDGEAKILSYRHSTEGFEYMGVASGEDLQEHEKGIQEASDRWEYTRQFFWGKA